MSERAQKKETQKTVKKTATAKKAAPAAKKAPAKKAATLRDFRIQLLLFL